MKDLEKMVLMLFLGIVLCIVVLGFHRSGAPTGTALNGSSSDVMKSKDIAGLL